MTIDKNKLKMLKAEKLKKLFGGKKSSETKVEQEKYTPFYHS